MRRLLLTLCMPLIICLCGFTAAPEGSGPGPELGIVTHLPVPRFVALRSNEVNFRAGPGFQYPVVWVYHREGLPVEIIGEFDVWRHILAPDGGTGWVHEATIRARRSFFVIAEEAKLQSSPGGRTAALLDRGVTGQLLTCAAGDDLCKVEAGHITGYLPRADLWGTFPDEDVK